MKVKKADLHIGQLVVVSDAPDAQVRTIAYVSDHKKFALLMWFEGERLSTQSLTTDILLVPTIQQIEYSINTYGALATMKVALERAVEVLS